MKIYKKKIIFDVGSYDGRSIDNFLDIDVNDNFLPKRKVVYNIRSNRNLDHLIKIWCEKIFPTNNEFEITKADLTYYRQPIKIQIQGCIDPYTNLESLVEVQSEFKDDIIEIIIDEAVSILAGDIESPVQYPRGSQTAERNN